jgi:hypothetical protein
MLLGAAALSILVGAVTAHFEPRYLVPAVPLLVAAGVLSICDVAPVARASARGLRRRRVLRKTRADG